MADPGMFDPEMFDPEMFDTGEHDTQTPPEPASATRRPIFRLTPERWG